MRLPPTSTSAEHATVASLLAKGSRRLREAGFRDASREGSLLLGHVLRRAPWRLLLEPETPVEEENRLAWEVLLERRLAHEPVAYLLGEREFFGRSFAVGAGVLVPRPETEGLVEEALRRLGSSRGRRIVDLGTGSGCLAVTLALEVDEAVVVATDVSAPALETARRNLRRHGVADRVELRKGAGLEPLQDLTGKVDLLVSNPPYVSEKEWLGLERQVRDWEPKEALVPGPTGLELLEEICTGAAELLVPDGGLLLEIGAGQALEVGRLLARGWRHEVVCDLAGHERVVVAERRERE